MDSSAERDSPSGSCLGNEIQYSPTFMAHTVGPPLGQKAHIPMLAPGFLAKERIIAPAGFNRWLVLPAALAIHLCIGMAYGFSVFWLPLSQAIGVKEAVAAPASASWIERIFSTQWDWKVSMLGWVYTLFFVLLGSL